MRKPTPGAATLHFEGKNYYFREPEAVFETTSPDQVMPILNDILEANHAGHFVIGYLSYEAAMGLATGLTTHEPKPGAPVAWFASYKLPVSSTEWHNLTDQAVLTENELKLSTTLNEPFSSYQAKIEQIHQAIARGTSYQINYTIRANCSLSGDPLMLYQALRNRQPTNYAAYLETPYGYILSLSPELFFKTSPSGRIVTKPMKGTSARGQDTISDQRQKKEQLLAPKNKAENVMIVDLLRNDLSKVCEPGSVEVTGFLEAEAYPTVWQLTSTIEGQLRAEVTLVEILQALFPCGSVTGAPKRSTMSLIRQLESTPRGVYCGAIGLLHPSGAAIFNVPIRTLCFDYLEPNGIYGVGGGITWHSTAHAEYEEVLIKQRCLQNL